MGGIFDGIPFRSHAEFRWAIFFHHLDIDGEYEPQGFVTDGEPYLPDFALRPALGLLWVEVKGSWESDPAGIAKWRRFATQRYQPSRAVLLTGLPSTENSYLVIGGDDSSKNPLKGGWEDDAQKWRPCPSGDHFDLAYPGTFHSRFAEDGCKDNFGGDGEARLRAAVKAAMSYRFGKHPPGSGV